MGNIIKMASARDDPKTRHTQSPEVNMPEDFWFVVGDMFRAHVTGEIKKLRAEFDTKLADAHRAISYQGVWEQDRQYSRGMFVSHRGSLWHCNQTTRQCPGNGSADWQLAVKAGRDAR